MFGSDVVATASGGVAVGFYRDVFVEPPTGQRLAVGRISLTPGGSRPEPVVDTGPGACTSTSSTLGTSSYLDVLQATYDGDGRHVVAADLALDCGYYVPVLQVRLDSDVPFTTASADGTQSATFTGTPGSGSATFRNTGTTTVHPSGVSLSQWGGPAPS